VELIARPLPEHARGVFERRVVLKAPADVAQMIQPLADQLPDVEAFWVLILNTQHRVTDVLEVSRGTLTSSLVHPREVFRAAIERAASGIVLAHNHPSGNMVPSADDRAVTRQMVEAGRVIDIPVIDHIVVGARGENRYFSFAEAGLI
jgi:DNA repair protein RadC